MFSWFKPKERWRLVKTIMVHVGRGGVSGEKGKLYYHLHESDLGNRKVEYACTISGVDAESGGRLLDVYQETIYRWEHGRADPEIPRYGDIPEEDTVNILKGKV